MASKAFTNEAWRHMTGAPPVTILATRTVGTGPLRRGHRYEVRLDDGTLLGFVECAGSSAWAILRPDGTYTGNDLYRPWYGTLGDVVWSLNRPTRR